MKNLCSLLFFFLSLIPAYAQTVEVGIESQDVYLNEPFIFQIRVSADDEVSAPALPPLPGFTVVPQPPQRSHSSQLSIINGPRAQTITVTTTFNYLLTPQKLGTLTIPSVDVNVLGSVKRTQPIPVTVRQAEKIDGIALQLQPSTRECYVGEPVMLTWRWYIDRQIYQYAFNLPVLTMPDFSFPEYLPEIDPRRQRQYQRINNHQNAELIAVQSNARLKGKAVTVLTFEKPFIPLKSGTWSLPESTVLCEIEDTRAGRAPARRGSPFDDFDSFFGRRTSTRKISVSAPPLTINVKALPTENQPDNFSGIVGACSISATAEPLEVNVGDPIILTITLAGPRFLDHLKLPPLETLPGLTGQFKISNEEPGQVQNGTKVFQRTLRANHHEISEIPALEIPFFNSQKGVYDFARSAPIPIKVEQVRQVTLLDAQASALAAKDAPVSRELQISDVGIAHNYDAAAILSARNHDPRLWLASPTTRSLLLIPPSIWVLAVLSTAWFRRRNANPGVWAARKAGSLCRKRLQKVRSDSPDALDQIFDILQEYLTARFQLKPGVVTYTDLSKLLQARKIAQETCLPFKDIFAACEASRFAGASGQSAGEIRAAALEAVQKLERTL